jgi:hypothetical protein
MKKFLLAIFLALITSPAWATTYHLAPASGGGNDSNNGTSTSTPWLTPNHTVNCGDTISATPSTAYSASNFGAGKWGTVSCPAGNSVVWLTCATFDACKINASGQDGMRVTASFWGVQGWEVTASNAACFTAAPSAGSTIHHIIFANNIANGCSSNGFNTFNSGNASVDYIAVVANIAYNAAQGSSECFSGISIYQPVESDSLAGTHIYVAGNFSYANFDPDPCGGVAPSDGEGIIFDTFDGSQGHLPQPYAAQAVAENNILFMNGGRGIEVFNNNGSSSAAIYIRSNTVFGNNRDTHQNASYCGEILTSSAKTVQTSLNLAVTNAANGCGNFPIYALYIGSGNGSDSISNNFAFSQQGTNTGVNNSSGFSFGSNTVGTSPGFPNAVDPGAPNCGAFASVPACMATVISNFTPQAAGAAGMGRQSVQTQQANNPQFPQWLCNTNLPAGLITTACSTTALQPPTALKVTSVN